MTNWEYVYINGKQFENQKLDHSRFGFADLDMNRFNAVSMHYAQFNHANLRDCLFTNCDLGSASFNKADLTHANFTGSDLEDCSFEGANLRYVTGLKMVTPVGHNGRNLYAYVYQGKIRIQAGCRNDVPKAIRVAVREDYDDDPINQADYMDAITLLEKWGRRELVRVKAITT